MMIYILLELAILLNGAQSDLGFKIPALGMGIWEVNRYWVWFGVPVPDFTRPLWQRSGGS